MDYGRWTLLWKGPQRSLCICECGTERSVRNDHLRSGRSLSCGCIAKDLNRKRRTSHGLTNSPEYTVWIRMKDRCYNPNNKRFRDYGFRGISVDDAWRNDFAAFIAHVGRRPSTQHSLDRIDTNGHYEPGNVRWATRTQQANNTRNSRRVTAFGATKTVAEWAAHTGIGDSTISKRLSLGWAPERALTHPVRHQ